ncbi:MAG: hypothetical protein HRT57_03365 [Crocinitomicaceae bacterium]|nr:hypothetical protein [Crocinitomicaceae bacterium]
MKLAACIVFLFLVKFYFGQEMSEVITKKTREMVSRTNSKHEKKLYQLKEVSDSLDLNTRLDTLQYEEASIYQYNKGLDSTGIHLVESYFVNSDSVKWIVFLNGDKVSEDQLGGYSVGASKK